VAKKLGRSFLGTELSDDYADKITARLAGIAVGDPLDGAAEPLKTAPTGRVGEHMVPMPHFGLVLQKDDWQAMADRLRAAGVAFVIEPQLRFAGQPGEQWTMFFYDPSGNPIEIKGFPTLDALFQTA
jgi:extradiol dioxygenase family protein